MAGDPTISSVVLDRRRVLPVVVDQPRDANRRVMPIDTQMSSVSERYTPTTIGSNHPALAATTTTTTTAAGYVGPKLASAQARAQTHSSQTQAYTTTSQQQQQQQTRASRSQMTAPLRVSASIAQSPPMLAAVSQQVLHGGTSHYGGHSDAHHKPHTLMRAHVNDKANHCLVDAHGTQKHSSQHHRQSSVYVSGVDQVPKHNNHHHHKLHEMYEQHTQQNHTTTNYSQLIINDCHNQQQQQISHNNRTMPTETAAMHCQQQQQQQQQQQRHLSPKQSDNQRQQVNQVALLISQQCNISGRRSLATSSSSSSTATATQANAHTPMVNVTTTNDNDNHNIKQRNDGQQQQRDKCSSSSNNNNKFVNFGSARGINNGANGDSDSDEPSSERKKKYLTAKYGQHQMSLIKKRLRIEMWLYEKLQQLSAPINTDCDVNADSSSGCNSTTTTFEQQQQQQSTSAADEVDIDLDNLLDMSDDNQRRQWLKRKLAPLSHQPASTIEQFVTEIIEQSKLL